MIMKDSLISSKKCDTKKVVAEILKKDLVVSPILKREFPEQECKVI